MIMTGLANRKAFTETGWASGPCSGTIWPAGAGDRPGWLQPINDRWSRRSDQVLVQLAARLESTARTTRSWWRVWGRRVRDPVP